MEMKLNLENDYSISKRLSFDSLLKNEINLDPLLLLSETIAELVDSECFHMTKVKQHEKSKSFFCIQIA